MLGDPGSIPSSSGSQSPLLELKGAPQEGFRAAEGRGRAQNPSPGLPPSPLSQKTFLVCVLIIFMWDFVLNEGLLS